MIVTKYSLMMGMVWFTCVTFLGSCLLSKEKGRTFQIVALVFLLGAARALLPVEILHGHVVQCWNLYPQVRDLWNLELLPGLTVLEALAQVWAVGATVFLVGLAAQIWRLHQIRLKALPLPEGDPVMAICRAAAQRMGYEGALHLVTNAQCDRLVMIGFQSPWILLPGDAAKLSEEELFGALCHEICHFQRRDMWRKIGFLSLRCLFWWNPAAYLMARKGEHLMELECDRLVCQHLSSAEQLSYLNAIKKMIQLGSPNGDKIPMGFVGRTSKKMLLQRFRVALHPQCALSRKALVLIAILCVLAFLASYCFILQPASHPTSGDLGKSQVIPGPAETSFILHESDGTYSLIMDGTMRDILTAAEITTEPYCTYEIVEMEVD